MFCQLQYDHCRAECLGDLGIANPPTFYSNLHSTSHPIMNVTLLTAVLSKMLMHAGFVQKIINRRYCQTRFATTSPTFGQFHNMSLVDYSEIS